MRRSRDDPGVTAALERARVPGADEAEARAWEVVGSAYEHREPAPRRKRRDATLALAVAGAGAALVVGLSPAGARVGDFVTDVGEAMGIGVDDARPALRSLPAAGELLVRTGDGIWIVREDGSRRRLGDYEDGTWSPHGLYVAVTSGRELIAAEPDGDVRWRLTAPGDVADPRWSPSGYRIAYRSGNGLRVVAGDGTGDRLLARDVAPVAPAWRPIGVSKLDGATGASTGHIVTYVTANKDVRTVDVDTGTRLTTSDRDVELLTTPSSGQRVGPAGSPDARAVATIRRTGNRSELVLRRDGDPKAHVLFSARGELTGPIWSPDGHWLVVGWPEADQWLFIAPERPGRVVAFDRISSQFDAGAVGEAGFPRPFDWILPVR